MRKCAVIQPFDTPGVFFPPSAFDTTEWEARKQQGCCEVGASMPLAARPSFVTALHLPGCFCVVERRRLTGKWDLILKQQEHKQRGRIVFLRCDVESDASPSFNPLQLVQCQPESESFYCSLWKAFHFDITRQFFRNRGF